MSSLLLPLLDIFNVIVLTYFVVLNSSYLALTVLSYRALRTYSLRLKSLDVADLIAAADAPPISLIAPAFNEERTCVDSVRALLTMTYPSYEVVVVNDGSRDDTLARLIEAFELEPAERAPLSDLPTAPVRGVLRSRRHHNLWVVDKENGGKADALNAGLNFCRTPIFCAMDADTLLEPESLIRVVRPFLEDRRTIAAGGIIRIVNGCTVQHGRVTDVRMPRNLLAQFQVLEYLRAFLTGRMGWDALDAMLVISGAFGLFSRSAVTRAGGFSTTTVGEDMELVVRLHRFHSERKEPYRITFVPDPVAWTECPESLGVLARQRDRWQRGLAQSLHRHRVMLGRPSYGRVGTVAYPYYYILEMFGPIIELAGYFTFALAVVLGRVDALYVTAFLLVAFALGLAISLGAIALEELTFRRYRRFSDLMRLVGLAILENFGYRQLSTFWRVRGLLSARRQQWGAMTRRGFSTARATPAAVLAPLLMLLA